MILKLLDKVNLVALLVKNHPPVFIGDDNARNRCPNLYLRFRFLKKRSKKCKAHLVNSVCCDTLGELLFIDREYERTSVLAY